MLLNLWHGILSVLKNSSFYLQILFWLIVFLLFLDLAAFMLIFFSRFICRLLLLRFNHFFPFHASRLFCCPIFQDMYLLPCCILPTLNRLVLNFGDWGFSYKSIYFLFCKSLLRVSEILIFHTIYSIAGFPFVNCSCILSMFDWQILID